VSSVAGALFYLRVTSLRNAVVSRLARLKQPKYLLGAVVGVAYIYFFFIQRVQQGRLGRAGNLAASISIEQVSMFATLGAFALLVFIALCWLWTRERAALNFSEAEISFLFPAPMNRKTLIHYRLISGQLRLLFTSLIFALLSYRWDFLLGNAYIRIVGWWLAFSIVSLHITGSAFVLTKWLERGVTQGRRQIYVAAVLAALVFATYWFSVRGAADQTAEDLANTVAKVNYFARILSDGPLGYLLLPAQWTVQPLFATDGYSFLHALGPALLVFAAHYLWVLYSESSFEEASIAKAQKRAARIAAMRSGNVRLGRSAPKARRVPFNVASAPRVELAFLWKNLLSSAEYLRLRTALIAAVVIVAGSGWLKSSGNEVFANIVGSFSLGIAVYAAIVGPLIARQDLRGDLMNADILKTYPLRGWQIVLGEMLAPIVIITVLLWLLLLAAALNFESARFPWLTFEVRVWGSIGIALLLPLLCAVQMLVLNAGVVLFPAWMQVGQSRGAGIDVMGQRILFFVGLIVVIVVALLPASIIAAVVVFATKWFVGESIAAAFGLTTVLAILCAEIAVGIQWLGGRFEKFDLSAELRP
jgi:hypothetical protein